MKNGELMTTLELLDALKSLNGNASDYRVAQILKVKPNTVSSWRHGRSFFDDEVCFRVADQLGIQPEYVVACVHAERSKTPQARTVWTHIAAAFGTAAAVAMVAVLAVPLVQF